MLGLKGCENMRRRTFLILLLSFTLVLGCLGTGSAAGVQESEVVTIESLMCQPLNLSAFTDIQPVTRAYGDFTATISPSSGVTVGDTFSLNANDTVSYDCTYTPTSASVDFGLIDSNNHFHYLNVTTGSIDKTIRVSQRGSYTLAIRNNSNSAVTVTGTVNY